MLPDPGVACSQRGTMDSGPEFAARRERQTRSNTGCVGSGHQPLPLSASVRIVCPRLASAAIASVAFLGCVSTPVAEPTTPVLRTTFGTDTRGIQTEVVTPRGDYKLEVDCDVGTVAVTVNVGRDAVKVFNAVCGSVQVDEFDLSQTEPVEMSLTVDTINSTGEARLYRIQ